MGNGEEMRFSQHKKSLVSLLDKFYTYIQKPVDLVTPDALHKAMKKQILEDSVHAV